MILPLRDARVVIIPATPVDMKSSKSLVSGTIEEVQAAFGMLRREKAGQNRAETMATEIKWAFWIDLLQASDRSVRFRIAMSIALAVTVGIAAASAPLILKALFDLIVEGTPLPTAVPIVAAYLAVIFVTRLLGQIQTHLFATGEQRIQQRLGAKAFEHVLALPMDFHLHNPLGAIIRAHSMMLQGVRLMMVHIIHTLLPITVQLAAIIVIVATQFSAVTCVGLAVIAIVYATVFAVAARWQASATSLALAADARANTLLTDGLINIEPIKAVLAEGPIGADYANGLENGARQWSQASARRMLTGVAIAVLYVASASVFILLATTGAGNDAVSIGGLVLLFTYLGQIFGPLESAGYACQDVAQVVRYFDEWQRIASVEPEDTRGDDAHTSHASSNGPPAVRFDDVVLTYANGRAVLSGLTFEAPPGQVTAIVGQSGAGKTSIVRALLRYRETVSGDIRIDGVSTRHSRLRDLRRQIALVSQDTVLFHATLRQNLLFPQSLSGPDHLDDVLERLQLSSLIERLPSGLDTIVGERGQQLSGGERQRVAIARALLRAAPILVLDEPTSALDAETAEAVRVALFESPHRRTLLLITHRLDLAARADKIIVIANGKVQEEGSHDQLLAKRGHYANLWLDQQTVSEARQEEHDTV